MDNFSAHISAVDELSPPLRNTEVLWLTANATSRIQPLDQGIIRTFKAYYRQSWLQYMLAEFEEDRDPFSSMNLLKTFRYLLHAWQAIDDDTIANCWLHSNVNGPRYGPQTKQQYERQQRGYSSTTNPQNTASCEGHQVLCFALPPTQSVIAAALLASVSAMCLMPVEVFALLAELDFTSSPAIHSSSHIAPCTASRRRILVYREQHTLPGAG